MSEKREQALSPEMVATMALLTKLNQEQAAHLQDARRSARRAAIVALTSATGFIIVAAVGLTIFPRVKHIQVDDTGPICTAVANSEPIVSIGLVTDFAKECMLDLDGWGFDDYDRRLAQATAHCMTPEFRKEYMTKPAVSNRIQTVKDAALRVRPMTLGPPQIEADGRGADGRYRWEIQVPMKRTYIQGATKKGEQDVLYKVRVAMVPRQAYNPLGLAVENITETPFVK